MSRGHGRQIFFQDVLVQATGMDPETPADRRRRTRKALAKEADARTPEAVRQRQAMPATTRCMGQTQAGQRLPQHAKTSRAATGGADQNEHGQWNTPWGLWSAARKEKKDMHVTQDNISTMIDDIIRHKLDRRMRAMEHTEFQRKAWMQTNRSSSAWVTTCPKEHNALNARQFPAVAQTYFGVAHPCLEGVVGQAILQKSGRRGKQLRQIVCDPYGENLVKATLPGGGWTYHHNGINLQLHRSFRQSCMTSDMEVEDYFLRKVREMAISPIKIVPLLSKNLRGYVLDGHQTEIANGKYPAGVN